MNSLTDDTWELVAKYHKQHPFMNELKVADRRLVPENITFDAIIHLILVPVTICLDSGLMFLMF